MHLESSHRFMGTKPTIKLKIQHHLHSGNNLSRLNASLWMIPRDQVPNDPRYCYWSADQGLGTAVLKPWTGDSSDCLHYSSVCDSVNINPWMKVTARVFSWFPILQVFVCQQGGRALIISPEEDEEEGYGYAINEVRKILCTSFSFPLHFIV